MALHETLYDRKFRTPLYWAKVSDTRILGPEIIQQIMDKLNIIQEKMNKAQDHQKSYMDRCSRPLGFDEGDHVFFRVTLYARATVTVHGEEIESEV